MADANLRAQLENFSLFEHLTNEKISPKFLQLVKSTAPVADMSVIKDDNGVAFGSENDRKNFITGYYSNIYSEVPGQVLAGEDCIQDFLGPEITNHPDIINCKVPDNIKTELEREISLLELDQAVNKMRNNSAGGPDGLSVKFV
jgi:hypothetical protein